MNIKDLNLTELEEQTLTSLIDGLYAEEGFSDVDAKDIAQWINKDIKSVRGAVGSLVKKGIVWTEDNGSYIIIYLNENYYGLHPKWKNEVAC